jgi:hypothetical protein
LTAHQGTNDATAEIGKPPAIISAPARDRLDAIRARLKGHEWGADEWPDTCVACRHTRTVGHPADCWLDETITDLDRLTPDDLDLTGAITAAMSTVITRR